MELFDYFIYKSALEQMVSFKIEHTEARHDVHNVVIYKVINKYFPIY